MVLNIAPSDFPSLKTDIITDKMLYSVSYIEFLFQGKPCISERMFSLPAHPLTG